MTGGGLIYSSGGQVSVTGTGGGHAGDGGYDVGVGVESGGQITSSGQVNVTGTGGPGGGLDYGVLVSSDGTDREPGVVAPENSTLTMITSSAGLTVTGQGGGSNGSQGYDDGIHVDSGGVISDTDTGGLTLAGTGGAYGMGEEVGVRVTDAGSEIIGGGVGLSVTGDGGCGGNSAFSSGIAILGGGQIIWGGNAGLGTETIQGTGGTGEGGGNDGLLIDGAGSGIVFNADLDSNTDIQGNSGQPGTSPWIWHCDDQRGRDQRRDRVREPGPLSPRRHDIG